MVFIIPSKPAGFLFLYFSFHDLVEASTYFTLFTSACARANLLSTSDILSLRILTLVLLLFIDLWHHMEQNSNSLNSSLQLMNVKGEVAFGH